MEHASASGKSHDDELWDTLNQVLSTSISAPFMMAVLSGGAYRYHNSSTQQLIRVSLLTKHEVLVRRCAFTKSSMVDVIRPQPAGSHCHRSTVTSEVREAGC